VHLNPDRMVRTIRRGTKGYAHETEGVCVSKPTILIVDDLPENVDLINSLFTGQPYSILSAYSGEEALVQVDENKVDLILLDVLMPGMDGFAVCEQLKSRNETRLIPVIMITGLEDSSSKLRGIQLGVDDFITKPVNIFELKARAASLIKLKQYTDQLENAESILFSLALTVEAKDPTTHGHCNRLANYGMLLSEQIGLDEEQVRAVRRGGILHDIGKLAIQDSILLKPGPLTPNEFEIIQSHPEAGERICKPLQTMEDVLPIIRHHQERFDGSGYPDGLQGEEIPISARVVSLVDAYDALTSKRPYRDALDSRAALQVLDSEMETGKWDPHLLSSFRRTLQSPELETRIKAPVFEIERVG